MDVGEWLLRRIGLNRAERSGADGDENQDDKERYGPSLRIFNL
jgi:hypothetical protein